MAESWAARLTPEPFRDFLPYAAPSALKVIHLTQVASRALSVANHVNDETARAREALRLQESLRTAGLAELIEVSPEPVSGLTVSASSEEDRRSIGDRVLALYFHLLRWDGPLFLDLRPRHFSWAPGRQILRFYPSSLWCRPEPDFMHRLRALYIGFYRNDRAALEQGIDLYRWQSSPSKGFAERVEGLLRDHFGSLDGAPMRFLVSHFRATFDAIFREVASSRAKLHPDLTFLGVELVGLYLTLESLNVTLDVQRAFESAGG
ncbi:MAG: hypothetical protein ABUL62_27975 [Myxococcales bacterium]